MDQALKSIKRISYFDEYADTPNTLTIYIQEMLDAAYGCYIWPSALVMGEFVWYNRHQFTNKTLLEVGAGTSIPSLVLSKSTNAKLIISDMPNILPVIEGCLQLNCLKDDIGRIWVRALEWGKFNTDTSIDRLLQTVESKWPKTKIDFIFGSDTFYEPSHFEDLLMSVSFIMHHHNPNCKFFTTYQERSPKRSIQYLLDKWNLKCRMISKDSFFQDVKYVDPEDESSEVKVNAGTLYSIFLLEITKQ
ncbi:uncharacterized protein BX663DRAFT_496061 [Cokeromyces recurvatus]|uniref:uncharacterized protein n=1 Tax=Cokeromyces recurvatus TaxID=90255 RepID=UPI00221EB5F5|nr:uncharacterized protein BX663DRAFT_496061 [Cokeromyces recurvatus]KAI7906333.1 hypothetical protein BX663DRAFT_496061 [Cokeromyces recurvatus]